MLLDLRGIIELPGGKVTFDFEPDLSALAGGSITEIKAPAAAKGSVTNSAGLLTFTCDIEAQCLCTCARCLKEFSYPLRQKVTANITEHGDGEDPDGYFLDGDAIDATEIITTELILNTDSRMLCREDCAGLCQGCGADLNNEDCRCGKKTDPRLEVLKQLLE